MIEHIKLPHLLGALALVLLAAGCGQETAPAPAAPPRISLIVTGFLKGSVSPQIHRYSMGRTRTLGGFAFLASRVAQVVADRQTHGGALVVDLGGNLSGSAESHASQGAIVVDCLNHLPLAASVISNLEFTYGTDALDKRAAQAHFPFLASNLGFRSPDLNRRIQREVSVHAGGLRVVLMGLAPPSLMSICAPASVTGVIVDPGLGRVLAHAARAKETGADLVVLLSKIPVDNPRKEIMEAITASKVDALIGVGYASSGDRIAHWGHTVVAGLPGDDRGERILMLDLSVARGVIQTASAETEIIAPQTCTADPQIQDALTRYDETVMAPYREVVARASAPITKAYRAESALGDLVADAMRDATGAAVAVINNGAIQDDLFQGDITRRDLLRVIPFDNALVTVQATGKMLADTFQQALDRGSHFQVSGASYHAADGPGATAELFEIKVAGHLLEPKATYTVALTDFILQHSPALHGVRGRPAGQLRAQLEGYLRRRKGPIEPHLEGRLVFDRSRIASSMTHAR